MKLKIKKIKNLSNKIGAYPFVEVRWLDIEGDDGWSTLDVLSKEIKPIEVKSKKKDTMEDIGSTVIIPTSVIVSIKKLNL